MKLVLYDDYQLGVLRGDTVVDAGDAVADLGHHSPQEMMEMIICAWDAMQPKIEGVISSGTGTPLDSVTLQPPLPRPGKFFCTDSFTYGFRPGRNPDLEPRTPENAPFDGYFKASSSIVPTGSTVELPPVEARKFDFEPELAVVIGRRASRLSQAEALDYVFGYTQFIDVSALEVPGGYDGEVLTFSIMVKSWRTFAPLGPALVTADEVSAPDDLPVKLWVNGTLKYDYSTGELARHIAELLEEITNVMTLEPGDVVGTGTLHEALPPIQDGFKVRLGIEGFGPHLEVSVHDSLKRHW